MLMWTTDDKRLSSFVIGHLYKTIRQSPIVITLDAVHYGNNNIVITECNRYQYNFPYGQPAIVKLYELPVSFPLPKKYRVFCVLNVFMLFKKCLDYEQNFIRTLYFKLKLSLN